MARRAVQLTVPSGEVYVGDVDRHGSAVGEPSNQRPRLVMA